MIQVAKLVLLVLAGFLVLITVLPLLRAPFWWIRIWDFPRAQIAVAMLGVLALYGLVNLGLTEARPVEWVVFVLLGLGVGIQGVRMWPYTPLAAQQTVGASDGVPDDRRFRLVISNVLMENRAFDRWERVVRAAEPDVIAAVETDAWWAEQMRALHDDYPHRIEQPQDDTYGMVVYSRFPLVDTEVKHLTEPTVPSVFTRARLPSGDTVQFVFLHPRPPRPDIQQNSTWRDAELVLAAHAIEDLQPPIVVGGDLNDVAWSRTTRLFQELSGLLDPRIGRGLFATFHADHWYLRYPLDHVFHSDDLTLVDLQRLESIGGDHFPIAVTFAYEPDREREQATPEADAEDEAQGAEMVEDAAEEAAEESPEERREREQEDR
ncbi:MAG: endonuclease/exonuclease/phosphatase family protein [Rubricoccaceae bacterium]|nr:endonuclease/exonuclease/phosphatase family protein [Rubricoccaceae bacterium]